MIGISVEPTPLDGRERQVERLVSARIDGAIRAEALVAQRLATRAMLVALAVVAVWLVVLVDGARLLFLELNLVLFALTAIVHERLANRPEAPAWWSYAVIAIYFTLLTFSMVGYDLLIGDDWPPQMMLREGTFVYFFMFLAIIALSHAPGRMAWAGLGGAASWATGVYALWRQPGTKTPLDMPDGASVDERLAHHLDPGFIDLEVIAQDMIVLLIVAGILAAGALRTHQLVRREARAERARANLARYFPSRIVDRLAQADEPLGAVRARPVAVLFADIVGFTGLSEDQPPTAVIAFLRAFHARLERAVFEHDGTLDKYLGDGVMATFGTPESGDRDPVNALVAARAMLAEIDAWNHERAAAGTPPVRLSIAIHHGEVVIGDIGSVRRLEFAVIGDVVNVASRLEALTRNLGTRLVVSDALVEAVRATPNADAAAVLAGLHRAARQSLRGRSGGLGVWRLVE